jgi:hypothetical protein
MIPLLDGVGVGAGLRFVPPSTTAATKKPITNATMTVAVITIVDFDGI